MYLWLPVEVRVPVGVGKSGVCSTAPGHPFMRGAIKRLVYQCSNNFICRNCVHLSLSLSPFLGLLGHTASLPLSLPLSSLVYVYWAHKFVLFYRVMGRRPGPAYVGGQFTFIDFKCEFMCCPIADGLRLRHAARCTLHAASHSFCMSSS